METNERSLLGSAGIYNLGLTGGIVEQATVVEPVVRPTGTPHGNKPRLPLSMALPPQRLEGGRETNRHSFFFFPKTQESCASLYYREEKGPAHSHLSYGDRI